MDHEEVGRYWDENAEVWTELVRAGYDHYRDGLNTPAFLDMLPDVNGLSGLDVVVEAEFVLERFGEPCPSDEAVEERPGLQDAQIVAYFLHIRARKPAGTRS